MPCIRIREILKKLFQNLNTRKSIFLNFRKIQMFLFLLILGLQARLKNGKRALADKWYVNEGDIDVTIPCEMDIGKLMTIRSGH